MSYRSGLLTGVLLTLAAAGTAVGAWWIVMAPSAAKPMPPTPHPATVGKTVKEDQLAVNPITLTPEAEKQLQLGTAPVERKHVPRVRVYGGEVTIPAGRSVIVAAPLNGTLRVPEGGVPQCGQVVKKGQPIFLFLPLLTPEGRATIASARVEADGQVENAKTTVAAAKIALDRAKRVFSLEAGSQRQVDEAQAQYDLANKTLDAAQARSDLLARVAGEADKGTAAPLPVESPQTGLLRSVTAQGGQNVPGGAALFEVVDLDTVWVRVPVYVGDTPELDTAAAASVGNLSAQAGPGLSGRPVTAPPSANPLTGTVDLYYGLDNREAKLSPGQRVGVSVPLKSTAEDANGHLTVPWGAVFYDVYGGTWVYERTADRTYVRRRVVVLHVRDGVAVLERGPPAGSVVVTEGVAELFGTEVGFSK